MKRLFFLFYIFTNIAHAQVIIDGTKPPTILTGSVPFIARNYSPLDSDPKVLYSTDLVKGNITGNPIMKLRRPTSADYVDVCDFNDVYKQYKICGSDQWVDGEAEIAYIDTWYDQSGNGINCSQATASFQPKLIFVEKNNSSLTSGLTTIWENRTSSGYDTFISSGTSIISAIESSGDFGGAFTDAFSTSINVDDIFLIEFDLTLNSGTLPKIAIANATKSAFISNVVDSTVGRNAIYLKTVSSSVTGYLEVYNIASTTSDFSLSNFSIRKITAFRASLEFDGINDFLVTSSNIGITGNPDFAIMSNVKFKNVTIPQYPVIAQWGSSVNGQGTFFGQQANLNSNFFAGFFGGGSAAVNAITFTHQQIVWNRTGGTTTMQTGNQVYVDGVLQTVVPTLAEGSVNIIDSQLSIGKRVLGTVAYISGDIADLIIFDKKLSDDEISKLNSYY